MFKYMIELEIYYLLNRRSLVEVEKYDLID